MKIVSPYAAVKKMQNARLFLSETLREHLEKPFEPGNLRAIVQRYLR